MKDLSWQTLQRFEKKQMMKTDPCINVELIRLGSAPPYRRITGVPPSRMLPNLSNNSPRIFQLRSDKRPMSRKPTAQRQSKQRSLDTHTSLDQNDKKSGNKPKEELLKSFQEILHSSYINENSKKRKNLSRSLNVYITSPVPEHSKELHENRKTPTQNHSNKTRIEKLTFRTNDKLKISGVQLNYNNDLPLRNNTKFHFAVKESDYTENIPGNEPANTKSTETSSDYKESHKFSMSFDQEFGDRISLNDYCKQENERYLVDYKAIKTILFHRWLGHSESYMGNYQPIIDENISEDYGDTDDSNNQERSDG